MLSRPIAVCPECGCTAQGSVPGSLSASSSSPYRLGSGPTCSPGNDAKEEGEITGDRASPASLSPTRSPCIAVAGNEHSARLLDLGPRLPGKRPAWTALPGQLGTHAPQPAASSTQWIDERFQAVDDITFTADRQSRIDRARSTQDDRRPPHPASRRPALASTGPAVSSGAVKAAYYSAAFILRSLAAELLDTDPEEFDVSNVRQVELADGQKAGRSF